jgi:hypothetical protein
MKKALFFALLTIWLGSCTISAAPPITTSTLSHPALATELPLSETPSPKPMLEPTWTLPATLPAPDGFSKINEFLETNGGCRFPCWWGITPGETSWEDARNIVFPLAGLQILDGQSSSGAFLAGLMMRYEMGEGQETGFEQSYTIKDGIVEAIKIKFPNKIPTPKLKDVLTDYGIPDEVYLGGTYNKRLGWQSFWLFLHYNKQRIFIEYDRGIQPLQPPDELMPICFPEIDYAELHVWGPDYSFSSTLDLIIQEHNPTYHLEKISIMTTEEFYKKFTDPAENPCINTSSQSWVP